MRCNILIYSLQKSTFVASDRFIEAKISPKAATPGIKNSEKDAEKEQEGIKKAKKIDEKDKLRRIYITLMVGSLFLYLNFAKNPFNP